jgi:uncharacterized protein (TIGR03437 family)
MVRSACLAGLAWFGGCRLSASQLSLPSQSAPAGSSLLLLVSFAAQGDAVSGIQFDLQYDNSVMSVSATVGEAARNSGKSLYIATPSPDKLRFLIAGWNQALIPDGTLCTLFVGLNANASAGVYALKFSQAVRTNPQSQSAAVQTSDAAITIQGAASQVVRLQLNGILSAASLLAGPVSPGEIITLLGAGIGPSQPVVSAGGLTIGDTAVLFNGNPAPMLYAGPGQINAIVPYGISGKTTTQMQILYQRQAIATASLPVASAVPAIFTQDSSGVGPGAILNQDSSVNTPVNPGARGSVISLFATGAGQTNPAGVDAQVAGATLPTPVLPVSVQIAGLDAPVLYAGAAPGLVAGVLQVNCMVPAAAPVGPAVPITLTVGSATSQNGVTLAVN